MLPSWLCLSLGGVQPWDLQVRPARLVPLCTQGWEEEGFWSPAGKPTSAVLGAAAGEQEGGSRTHRETSGATVWHKQWDFSLEKKKIRCTSRANSAEVLRKHGLRNELQAAFGDSEGTPKGEPPRGPLVQS